MENNKTQEFTYTGKFYEDYTRFFADDPIFTMKPGDSWYNPYFNVKNPRPTSNIGKEEVADDF